MALLKVGYKAPVFVTHVDFEASECQIFCQVGDVGSQADTLAERVAECVENGVASPVSQCSVGDLCLALFHEDNSWYRGRVIQNQGNSVKVYFIDYGNTEVVSINNIREAPDYVLAIPGLSTKCVVCDCTPLGARWAEDEKKKTETLLHSGEFIAEIVKLLGSDVNNETYLVKLYTNDAPNTPIFVRPAASSSLMLKPQNLSLGKVYEVYISFVESAKKFWVQLKSEENELNSLMTDVAACFAEDLPSTGDIVNPVNGQVCAACFSDDGAFYRGIVKNVQGGKCTVFFVDYGNHEDKSTSELFTLPQALCKLPMQAIQCAYKTDNSAVENKLHELSEAENPLSTRIVSGSANTGYVVEISTIDQKLAPATSSSSTQSATSIPTKLWQSYSSVLMQVNAIYDVCISHVEHPGEFYVQLIGNAKTLDALMQGIDEVAHNYDRLTNLYPGYQCLAKFSDESWYRGEVLASEPGKTTVAAVDFGFIEALPPSQLRNTDPNFKVQPAQAVKCSIDLNRIDKRQWTAQEVMKFQALTEKHGLVVKVTTKKGCVHLVELYETESGAERNLNKEFLSSSAKPQVSSPPKMPKIAPVSLVSLAPPAVSVGMKLSLCFTAVKQQYLYGQLTNTPVEKVAKLQTDVNTYYEKPREALNNAAVGNFCCTQYVDGGWYRSVITGIVGGKVEVAFVDFGDSVHKSVGDLKTLPASLCDLPQQCLLCKLDNAPSSIPSDKLEKVLVNKRVEVKLTQKEDGVFPTYRAEIVDSRIVDQLQDKPASQGVFKGASSRTFGRPPRDDNMVARKPIKKTLGDSYTIQEVTVNSTQDVMVTYVKDPSCFQVVLDKMNDTLDAIMDQLHVFYDGLPPNSEVIDNPTVGQACVTQFSEDKAWYRAVITGVNNDGHAEVMFVDYGNNEYTDSHALKKIQPQFMELPAQAVQCRLSGVASPQGFWSPEHTVKFSEMVEEQAFAATFKSELQEQGLVIYKVELVDKKGTNVNEVFGRMTGTSCPETSTGPVSRAVSSSFKTGDDMKITVGGDNRRSFGGPPSGDSGWDDGASGGGQKSFGSGGGFGGNRDGGFSSSRGSDSGGGGFGSSSAGGFGGSRGGSGFGNSGGGSSGFGSSGFGSSGGSGFGGGGGGSKDCFKCGESGHFSRECPNAAKAGAGGGRECYKCGEGGHMARDCTNPPKAGAGGGRECYKCGEGGHMARDCTNPPKAGGGGGGRECYKCGEGGHMARDCTNPPKAGGGGGGRECYKCGESGHMARDCTNPPKEGAGPGRGGGFGGGDRSGGFGGGGFGQSSSGGGFGQSSSGGGFGQRSGDSGGFGSKGGGFGGSNKPSGGFGGQKSGGFGSGDGGGFGQRSGGFGGGSSAAPSAGGGDDDWGTEALPVQPTATKASPAGDGPDQLGSDAILEPLTLVNGDTVDVYVVYTVSPELFWCQIIKQCKPLEELMNELNSYYNGLPDGDLMITNPEPGKPCAAKFSEDNMWYRAEVKGKSPTEVEVLFVDYGNTEKVPCDKLRRLKPEYMKLKAQGIKCSLDDVVPGNKTWSDKSTEDFEDMTHDKHLLARVNGVSSSTLTHMIDLENVDEKLNIAETMCDKGHCTLKPSKSSPVKVINVKNPYSPLSLEGEIDVYVSWIENPARFWVQPTSKENDLLELVEKVQELYTTGAGVGMTCESMSVGQAVVAQFTEDEAWYRGYIERIAGDKCSVRFVDYGNAELVSKDLVRQPTEELLAESAHAGVCKLHGIRPLQSGQFVDDARDFMDGLVKDEVVKCTVVDNKEGFSVELVAKGLNVSEELVKTAVVKKVKPVVRKIEPTGSATEILQYNGIISLVPKSTENMYISHTDSVASFWCQLAQNTQQLEDLMAQLETHCQSSTDVADFPVGMACAAKFSEDGQWYRSEVTASYPDTIEVLFVDYGNTEKVPRTDICLLKEEHVQLPPQAIECELVNCSTASNQSTAKFSELIGDQEVKAIITDTTENGAVVQIVCPDGTVVGEALGLSEPGSTTVPAVSSTVTSPVKVTASPITTTPAVTLTTYPDVVMPTSLKTVFVTQIINPGEFYVQVAGDENQLNDLMTKLSQYCQTEAQTLTNVSVGQVCCAKYAEDGNWYRGCIVKIEGSNPDVEFVDYGNCEITTVENIKSIAQNFVSLPLFALRCSLEGVSPLDGTWSNEAVKKFEDLAVGKDLLLEAVGGTKVIITCDGVDVASNLIESGLVKEIKGRKTQSKPTDPLVDLVLQFKKRNLPCDPVDVYISHVNSPADFYVQIVSEEDNLNALMEQIAGLYETSGVVLPLNKITVGRAVCAKYSEDEAWYRAEVVSIDGENVTVQFVDYGNSEQTTCDSIKALTADLAIAPVYAVKCGLGNGESCDGKWAEESQLFLETLTAEKVVHCEFVDTNLVSLKVDDKDVLECMIEKGYAKKLTVVSPTKRKGDFMPQSVPADSVSCYVSHIDDDGTVYLQLVCEEDRLITLVEQVQTLQSRAPLPVSDINLGDNVCAKFSEDQSWYRAIVIDKSAESVTVRFVDYGNCDTLSQSEDFRALPADFLVTAPFAYTCSIQGLTDLTEEQVGTLRDVTTDKELTATFNTCSPMFEIQLMDENETNICGAILGDAAVKDEAIEETTVAESASNLDTEPEKPIEFEIIEPSDKSCVDLRGNRLTEQDVEQKESSEEVVGEETEQSDVTSTVDITTITCDTTTLTAEKLTVGQRVKVLVSYSESPSKFWVQLESNQERLDNLLTSMFDLYSTCTDSSLTVDTVSEGMLVAALYSEDESWYRAKVLSTDDNTVTVQFLDHGNTQTVEMSNLRKVPTEFCSLPIQAMECVLGAVQPSSGSWTDEAKDTFNELTQEKELLLDVGSSDDAVCKVQLLDMGMSVSDILLQKNVGIEIATPVAVSTKVKQVFSPESTDQVIARLYDAKSKDKTGKYGYKLRDLSSNDPLVSSHNVMITAIDSPLNFWCQLQDSTYSFYQDKLQDKYSTEKQQLTNVTQGEKCVCCIEGDYYRGSIVECKENTVTVKLVDIGTETNVDVSSGQLYEITEQFCKYPQLAFNCKLSGKTPVSELKNDAGSVFKEIVTELNELTELPVSARAAIVSEDDDTELVVIRLNIDRKDIAESLMEKGVIELETADDSILDSEQYADILVKEFGAFKYMELKKDTDYDVVLVDCIDMNKMVFHLKATLEDLKAMDETIAEYVKDKEGGEGMSDFTSGACLAKCPADQKWYRANVVNDDFLLNKDSSSELQVFFVDYGSTYHVADTGSLLPLPDTLKEEPGYAVICRLGDIAPVDEEWSEECYSLLKEQYMIEDAGLAMYVNSCHKGMHDILLSCPKSSEKSINFLLIEIGLAAPVDMAILAETTETSFHELSMSRQDSYGDSSDLGDTSCLTETDTSFYTEGDTSAVTEGDTSAVSEGDTSQLTEGDTDLSYQADTSQFTEGDTSQFSTADESSYQADGDVSGTTEEDGKYTQEDDSADSSDTSVDTVNETNDMKLLLKVTVDLKRIDDIAPINQLSTDTRREVSDVDVNGNELKGDEDEGVDINGELEPIKIEAVTEIPEEEGKVDTESKSTEESDLDESYTVKRFHYSPTGYTTSELDTTDLRELDETTETADIDTTGLTDFDTTGIEGGGEDLSILEDGSDLSEFVDDQEEEGDGIVVDDVAVEVVVMDENSNYDDMKLKNGTGSEGGSIPDVDCKLVVEDDGGQLFPSVSDTTYPSTLTSVSDFTFTSAYDTSQTDTDVAYDGVGEQKHDGVFNDGVIVEYIETAESREEGLVAEIAQEEETTDVDDGLESSESQDMPVLSEDQIIDELNKKSNVDHDYHTHTDESNQESNAATEIPSRVVDDTEFTSNVDHDIQSDHADPTEVTVYYDVEDDVGIDDVLSPPQMCRETTPSNKFVSEPGKDDNDPSEDDYNVTKEIDTDIVTNACEQAQSEQNDSDPKDNGDNVCRTGSAEAENVVKQEVIAIFDSLFTQLVKFDKPAKENQEENTSPENEEESASPENDNESASPENLEENAGHDVSATSDETMYYMALEDTESVGDEDTVYIDEIKVPDEVCLEDGLKFEETKIIDVSVNDGGDDTINAEQVNDGLENVEETENINNSNKSCVDPNMENIDDCSKMCKELKDTESDGDIEDESDEDFVSISEQIKEDEENIDASILINEEVTEAEPMEDSSKMADEVEGSEDSEMEDSGQLIEDVVTEDMNDTEPVFDEAKVSKSMEVCEEVQALECMEKSAPVDEEMIGTDDISKPCEGMETEIEESSEPMVEELEDTETLDEANKMCEESDDVEEPREETETERCGADQDVTDIDQESSPTDDEYMSMPYNADSDDLNEDKGVNIEDGAIETNDSENNLVEESNEKQTTEDSSDDGDVKVNGAVETEDSKKIDDNQKVINDSVTEDDQNGNDDKKDSSCHGDKEVDGCQGDNTEVNSG